MKYTHNKMLLPTKPLLPQSELANLHLISGKLLTVIPLPMQQRSSSIQLIARTISNNTGLRHGEYQLLLLYAIYGLLNTRTRSGLLQ